MDDKDRMRPVLRRGETENYTEQNPLCPNRKLRHFSHFSYPPVIPRGWRTALDATNITFTKFSITHQIECSMYVTSSKCSWRPGTGYDEQKAYGADFFPCNFFLTENETYSAGTSSDGEVVDHLNGTYSAYFTLQWDGILRINVTLVWWVLAISAIGRG